ncbi:MAG: hypothetical protein ACJAYB_000966 [Psychromonas sp.]|jgi:hypothetical protein
MIDLKSLPHTPMRYSDESDFHEFLLPGCNFKWLRAEKTGTSSKD